MESPVRINAGLLILIVLISFESCRSFPSQNVGQKVLNDNTSQESSTLYNKEKNNASSLFQPRNKLLYQRRNAFNMTTHPNPQNVTPSTENSAETTVSYGNKINFRGSVKYFATRPPFKPKNPYLKRNSTIVKSETSEKPEISKFSTTNKTKSFKLSNLPEYRFRKNDTEKKYTSPRPIIVNTSEKPEVEKNDNDNQEPIQMTTEKVQYQTANRSEGSKSLGLDFNIDKYTSPEFHDINNVYSQSVSPEVEHFIVPENVSEYFVSVGSAPLPKHEKYYEVNNGILTTPQTDLFDQRFKEVSDSIKQNLAESLRVKDVKTTTEKYYDDAVTDSVNFEELLSKANDNHAKVMFKNTKEIILSDSEKPMSKHSDYTDSNGTKIFYEMTDISTESYDQSSSTIKILPEETKEDLTTSSPISNEVISSDNRIAKKDSNFSRIFDNLKFNGTRREFPTTIRMRVHTTPRPRVRISLKNKLETEVSSNAPENASATNLPQLVKMFPFPRRRNTKLNNTLTTVASKLDPVYEGDTSPTRIAEHTRFNSDNSIPILRKRGSLKYYEGNMNSTSSENSDSESYTPLHIPPTATAWALISMKDTPGAKKNNGSQNSESISNRDVTIKTEDELQKLEKSTDASNLNINLMKDQTEHIPTAVSKKPIDKMEAQKIDEYGHEEITSASRFDYATVSVPKSKKQENLNTQKDSNSSDENIHSQSSNNHHNFVTTELYESQTTDISTTDVNFDELNLSTNEDYDNTPTTESDVFVETKQHSETTTYSYSNIMKSKSNMTTYTTPQNIKFINTSPSEADDREEYDDMITSTTESVTETLDDFSMLDSEEITSENKDNEIMTSTSSNEDRKVKENPSTQRSDLPNTESNLPKVSIVTPTTMDIMSFSEDSSDLYTESDKMESKFLDDVNLDTTPDIMSSTENSNSVYSKNFDKKQSLDIDTSSTTYYSPIARSELTSPFSITTKNTHEPITLGTEQTENEHFKVTSEEAITSTLNPMFPSKATVTTTKMTIPITSEENQDSREAKKTNIDNEERSTTSTINYSDQNDNLDDWLDSPDLTVDVKQLDSNEIPSNNASDTDIGTDTDTVSDLTEYNVNEATSKKHSITSSTTHSTNIEVIKPNSDAIGGYPHETTPLYIDDMTKYEENVDNGSGAIAAITISVIGVVALLLLVGVLMVARGRRRSGGYGQRCTPVSLDSYSLDNVSISGSTRRKARRPSKRSYGNPAYDESGATSHPMQFAALANFALDQESIISEFNEIPTITARADEVPAGCESKNRYSNVIPLPETRVMLNLIPGDDSSEYINANYVRGPKNIKNYYIACQAPLVSTVNDFWRMIWEQNSRVILMLTEFMENGVEKCYEYLPPSEVSDSRRLYGDYQIVLKKREVRDKYVISVLQVKCISAKLWREITHMWYFWPAKGVPDECHSIIAFLIEARSYLKASQNSKEYDEDGQDLSQNRQSNIPEEQEDKDGEINVYEVQKAEQKLKNGSNNNEGTESRKKSGPLVVHCSPGTGRTGALIACDIGIRDFEMSRTVDIPKTVYRIRRDRANAVQTKDQYIFIYKVLSEYATKLTGGILDSI